MDHRLLYILLSVACLVWPSLSAGAEKTGPDKDALLPDKTVQAYCERGKDPRHFGLTAYASTTGPVFSGANRVHEAQKCDLRFRSVSTSSVPVISFRRDYDAIGLMGLFDSLAVVDTSSHYNWISFDASGYLHVVPLKPGYPATPLHVIDPVAGMMGLGQCIQLDQIRVENPLFMVRMARGKLSGPLGRGQKGISAVLGWDFLRHFSYVRIDYPARRIRMATTAPVRENAMAVVFETPLGEVGGMYAVLAKINHRNVTIILDSAGDYGLALPPDLKDEMDEGAVLQFEMGELVMRKVPAQTSEELGLGAVAYPRVGMAVLSRFAITLDNKNRKFFLEAPSKPVIGKIPLEEDVPPNAPPAPVL